METLWMLKQSLQNSGWIKLEDSLKKRSKIRIDKSRMSLMIMVDYHLEV